MLIFICSPFAADTEAAKEENIAIAKRMCLKVLNEGVGVPIAPHLHYPRFLDDNDPQARETGMRCSKAILERCEQIWVYAGRTTTGMAVEIGFARARGIKILYLTDINCD